MPRDRGVGMDPAGVAALLAAQRTVTLATVGPDGRPHLAAMWFALDGADLLMWTYAAGQKTRNLERDPRATVLAEDGTAYDELRGACLDCHVDMVRDPAEVLAVGRALHARNTGAPGADPAATEDAMRAQAAKRVGLRLRIIRSRTWDHRQLAARA